MKISKVRLSFLVGSIIYFKIVALENHSDLLFLKYDKNIKFFKVHSLFFMCS